MPSTLLPPVAKKPLPETSKQFRDDVLEGLNSPTSGNPLEILL